MVHLNVCTSNMLLKKLANHPILSSFILLFCLQLNLVNGARQVISTELPYCNQVLENKCAVEKIQGSNLYKISCAVPYDETPWPACEIDYNHGLRIKLEEFTNISNILLDKSTFLPRFTKVFSTMGHVSCEFRHSPARSGRADADYIMLEHTFTKFSYNHNPRAFIANTIEITSIVPRTVPLTSPQPKRLSLDSILLQGMVGGGPQTENQVNTGNLVGTGTFGSDVDFNMLPAAGSQENGKLPEQCPPIDPYRGMPEEFYNYQLIVDGLINDALLTNPCRDGYRLVGEKSNINQCQNGAWFGSGFPVCQAIRTKTPPDIKYARWSYLHNDVFHEISYSCSEGYVMTGDSVVKYSFASDEWVGVPECQRVVDTPPQISSQSPWLLLAAIAVVGGIIFLGAVVAFMLLHKKLRRDSIQQVDDVNRALENGYTVLRNACEGELSAGG